MLSLESVIQASYADLRGLLLRKLFNQHSCLLVMGSAVAQLSKA